MSTPKKDKHKKSHKNANPSQSSSVAESSSGKKQQVLDTANMLLDGVANVAEASDILAPLKAACKTTKAILDAMQAIESNQEDWKDLVRRLKEYTDGIEKQIALIEKYPPADRAIHEAVEPLTNYIELLKGMQNTVVNLQEERKQSKLGFFKAFSRVKIDAGEIRQFNRNIEDRHRQLMSALTLFIALRVQAMEEQVKANADSAAILQLPTVEFAASSVHRTCQEGTRKAVLQMIWDWANDEASDKPIFWLCDIAGSGKSTVAMSVLETWQREGMLGGRFFFSIASNEASTTDKFCSAMARDLAQYIPQLASHVADAVKSNPSLMRGSLEEQFRTLITGPVLRRQQRVILVIDALDECKSGPQRKQLLDAVCTAVRECKNLRVFMTSRPDPIIQSTLGSVSIKAKVEDRLHDVNHPDNVDDIAAYVHRSLERVLSPDKRQRLVGKAQGLFIWASTACRMLDPETTWDTPENVYGCLMSVDKAGDIDSVYSLIFERIDPRAQESMCRMLALLLAAFEPLTVDELQDIFTHNKVRGNVTALIQHLGSVLSVRQGTNLIQFRHPTLVEYLRRCSIIPSVSKFSINLAKAHGEAAAWCLHRLNSRTNGLRFNICQLESSFCLNRDVMNLDDRISKYIPRALQYASSHWTFHVSERDDEWRCMLKEELEQITKIPYALYWMEVLSFTRGVPRAINGLQAIGRHTEIEEDTRARVTEVRRFMMAFSVPIQDSAPHIYISALPFSPKESKMHLEGLIRYRRTFDVTEGLERMYTGLPRALRGHQGVVCAVRFSPDGSRIVSGSSDSTVRLWATDTGQPLGELLRGHEGAIWVVGFSPDGSRIISGSEDRTIRLWAADTGQLLGEPLRGHESSVTAVDFSPDGSLIVSGSADGTIRLWAADTGEPLREPLRAHEVSVMAVEFSPDGSQIVSGCSDSTIRLWAADTGQPLGEPLRGHEYWVRAVGFSPDGSRIVSGSADGTIRLWAADTGEPLGEPLRGHESWVMAVEFSPDGLRIVSGSTDGTIRLWVADTGQPLGEPLRDHGGWVRAIGFSPDGSQIVSGSDDTTIRLWAADTGEPLGEPLQGHEGAIWAVIFSPDGSRIISGSEDSTIRLWAADTGEPLGEPLRGHEGPIWAVIFSPDGSRIISGSSDSTIRIWASDTGQPLGEPLRGHESSVTAVDLSSDGSRIVSGSYDKTIRLWAADTGEPLGEPVRGHESWVRAVRFSPDGSRIISGSEDWTIRIWASNTGQLLEEPLRGHEGPVMAVDLSSDGSRIVSGSDDRTIRLWAANTGQPLRAPLRGHEGAIWAVTFSPDGSRIISGSSDSTIRLWAADTGQSLGELRGHERSVTAIGFSPDGLQIVSGSEDSIIRLWGTETDGSLDAQPTIFVPGFEQCSMSHDGWVQSSNKLLFWVPPDNRNGLVYPHIFTIPTRSRFRPTRIDFTYFECGPSWTNVRADAT